VTQRTTEWFSFFYWGYFILLAVHVLPMTFYAKEKALTADFTRGICIVVCAAHLLYFVVPAFGPWIHLKGQFEHNLDGPVFWPLVRETVSSAGIRKDVFPSVHTAAPTFLAIFSWRHRKIAPFKYTWIPVALFASQTMLATMFLRWHYVIDVVCGLLLAMLANLVTSRIGRWENPRRERLGVSPA
jgi:membrane-associated phospholipid phosphatase